MYNIGVRIEHGTFHGIRMTTNHNFVSYEPLRLGSLVSVWGKPAVVLQSFPRSPMRPLTHLDTLLSEAVL